MLRARGVLMCFTTTVSRFAASGSTAGCCRAFAPTRAHDGRFVRYVVFDGCASMMQPPDTSSQARRESRRREARMRYRITNLTRNDSNDSSNKPLMDSTDVQEAVARAAARGESLYIRPVAPKPEPAAAAQSA
jgi:hypothetical protein